MLFWYVHFILLQSVFSVFFDFVVFSSQFATHFAIFRVAVSQMSRVSSILRLLLSILNLQSCFTVLRSCGLSFHLAYLALILAGFRKIQCFHLILPHFGFTLLVSCVVQDHEQAGKPDSRRPPGKIISALSFAQLFPRWFTNVYFIPGYVHFMFHD